MSPELDQLCINTIRTLAVDAVEKAKSGHPGTPMGLAPAAYVLWTRHLRFNPRDPHWPDRDRFVLSCGHASALLYAMLHLTGYDLTIEDLQGFRQWGSRTPGHPELGHAPGVETTTGPLGQGFANAVGMSMAEELMATDFNTPERTIVDHHTFGFCSDGDLMEGISHEAASLAGHLGIGKLIFLYDDNHITIDGPTELAYTDQVAERFAAYGWHVLRVADGNDLEAIDRAFHEAKAETAQPSLIICRTHIGYGAPTKQDTASAHGEPLGPEETAAWKASIGWPSDPFHVPTEAADHMELAVSRGAGLQEAWQARFEEWATAEPASAAEWHRRLARELPSDLDERLPTIEGEKMATRKAQQQTLAVLANAVPELVGGSADLTPSNGTTLGTVEAFARHKPGRYIHYGIREHAMAATMNGMVLHGGLRPYGGTFLIFSDYMRNSVRLAALMEIPTIFVYSHDSIGLGEDGPTHQPIEHLASLRAIPGLAVIRPGDANETVAAWRVALERTDGPSAIIVTRQDLPILPRPPFPAASSLERGAYVLAERGPDKPLPDLVLIGTGSEVSVALGAADMLAAEGVRARVVSMPCWELFAAQDPEYHDEVLPPDVTARVSVEAAASLGWERWTGDGGAIVSVDRFGASAPGATVLTEYGFTAEHVAQVARELL
ncbi:MAG: transketolase [Actinomycetota bacterium]